MSLMPPKVLSFGCRLNALESDALRHATASAQNITIVNTCAVTGEAVRQARQAIRRVRRTQPDTRIVVTGCAAQIEPQRFLAMPEVDAVVGNADKLDPARLLFAGSRIAVSDIMTSRDAALPALHGTENRARAALQIQNGCDHRCTFCVIPFGRGPSRSVPVNTVIEQAAHLVAKGHAEIVLTGVDLTAYGADLPGMPALGTLISVLLERVPALKRLRLSSIDSIEADDELLRLIAEEPRVMPYLHLSLQSGDDLILKRMKRRHRRADAVSFCVSLREKRPELVFGADLIAGFPTETEEMFENTCALVEECSLAVAHVFPFSPRPGTPAARMPQVPPAVVRQRARRLRALAAAARARFLSAQIGRVKQVLVEQSRLGRSEDYAFVALDRDMPMGAVVPVHISSSDGTQLVGTVCA